LPPEQRRRVWINFRVTKAERERLRAQAKRAGLSLAKWLRRRLGLD